MRPCNRCCRLGFECTSKSEPRKRACHNCHLSKVACGTVFTAGSGQCPRCKRLGLDCVAHEAPVQGARRKRPSPNNAPQTKRSKNSDDPTSLPSLEMLSTSVLAAEPSSCEQPICATVEAEVVTAQPFNSSLAYRTPPTDSVSSMIDFLIHPLIAHQWMDGLD